MTGRASFALARVGSLFLFAALCTDARSSLAAPSSTMRPVRVKKAAKPEPVAGPPAPQLTLEVTAGAQGAPWRLRLTNKETTPVRIVADPRLLSFELTLPAPPDPEPAAKKNKAAKPIAPLRCVLPSDARSDSDRDLDLVLPPSRSWSANIDPLFYCFGARERTALVPETTVKAHYAFSFGRAKKDIEADAFTLREAVVGEPAEKAATNEATAPPTLTTPPAIDVENGTDVATDVTLTNPSDHAVTLLFRSNMLQFDVVGPHSSTRCGEPRSVAAPIRELITTVRAKEATHTSVLVASVCPPGTFDDAGIYRVFPRLDTREASGQPLGIRTWDGVAVGKTPLLVRVRSARTTELSRPTID